MTWQALDEGSVFDNSLLASISPAPCIIWCQRRMVTLALTSIAGEEGTAVVVFDESEHAACAARAVLVGYASVV